MVRTNKTTLTPRGAFNRRIRRRRPAAGHSADSGPGGRAETDRRKQLGLVGEVVIHGAAGDGERSGSADRTGCRRDCFDRTLVVDVRCASGVCPNDGFYCRRGTFGGAPWNRVGAPERDQRCQLVQLDQLGVDLELLELATQPRGEFVGCGCGTGLEPLPHGTQRLDTSRCNASTRDRAASRQEMVSVCRRRAPMNAANNTTLTSSTCRFCKYRHAAATPSLP